MSISIAVVIPLYNKSIHIADTLNSVFCQRVQPTEIIVVDDGSTDGSAEIVLPYQKRGVRLIQQKNSGVSIARNRGVEASTSMWIAFLDADDLWLPNHIECLLRAIQIYPDVGLVSTQHDIIENGIRLRPRCAYGVGVVCRVDDFYLRFAVGLSLVNSSTACVRRNAVRVLGGFPEDIRIGEDIILWVKLFEKFGMAHIGTVSAVYQRDAVNRATTVTAVTPGSLTFLGDLLVQEGILQDRKKSIGVLFDKIAFFTAAGRMLQGDTATVEQIQLACKRSKRVLAWLAISLLTAIPAVVLRRARLWRHSRKALQ